MMMVMIDQRSVLKKIGANLKISRKLHKKFRYIRGAPRSSEHCSNDLSLQYWTLPERKYRSTVAIPRHMSRLSEFPFQRRCNTLTFPPTITSCQHLLTRHAPVQPSRCQIVTLHHLYPHFSQHSMFNSKI